jgi:hypothetical protein
MKKIISLFFIPVLLIFNFRGNNLQEKFENEDSND